MSLLLMVSTINFILYISNKIKLCFYRSYHHSIFCHVRPYADLRSPESVILILPLDALGYPLVLRYSTAAF
ncbi:hypothetical protein FR483_n709L [Paramecium bursaria Chlorella virus FR483]|uniref:Uncharacterized protein n709L n=1 Tax=Paramecium bursaria Chlorella virus FR483 TaxID=399781 RepID=A7J863_PBCVF|nr:hypothetical protein FR483_n709L [Paramecium bursaria Chlorella virus FR483]ABT15994.1 hypothetical protein FR483_n709L [Paramecium bursaria Chlorella virus FR483]